MKRRVSLSVSFAVLVAGVAAVSAADPDWAAAAGLDVWKLPGLNRQIDHLREESDDLDRKLQTSMARLLAKADVIKVLRNGRMTFRDAAQRFRYLNQMNPKFHDLIGRSHPDLTEHERQYWSVIGAARVAAEGDPDAEQFISRLETELRAMKDRGDLALDE